jgi:hypothetical protein
MRIQKGRRILLLFLFPELHYPRLIGNIVLEGAKFVLNKPFTMEEVQQMLSFIKV